MDLPTSSSLAEKSASAPCSSARRARDQPTLAAWITSGLANVLLHADNKSAEHHETARHWLLLALMGTESLLIPWISSLAYLKISTQPHALPQPLTVAEAMAFLRPMLSNPRVITGEPDQHHLERVEALLAVTGRGGNLVNDAHLAALALQYEATVVSFDNDFSRFPGVRWERPRPVTEN